MASTPKDELVEAKIELAEQRIETRLVGIESKIDRLIDRVGDAQKSAEEAKNAAVLTRWNISILIISGVAVIVAILAFGVQIFDLASGLFSAGASR